MGPRLHGVAREPDPRPLARHRYAALHADGVRHRFDARRRLRRALRAARRVRRSDAAHALARHPDDGDRRRRRLLLRAVPWRADRGAAAGVAALHAGPVPDPLRAPRHGAAGLFAARAARHPRPLPSGSSNPRRVGGPGGCRADARGDGVMAATVLQVTNVSKHFGGIAAVDGVSFEVREREILGIIGPNGSGKSTLFNCILGQLRPSAGDVRIDGRSVTGLRPCDLNRLGVSRTFQLLQIFPQLTARENLILAGQEHKGSMFSRLVGPSDAGLSERANRMLEFFRLDHLADEQAGSLSYGQQKLLDAAMAFIS